MATSPVLPSDAKAIVPDPNSTLCGNFLSALVKLPVLFYKLVAFFFDATGNASKGFVNLTLKSGAYVDYASLQLEDGTILLCDGREVARTDFPDLFAAIGVTYGAPSGSTVFKIPNFSAKFVVGIGSFDSAGSVSLGVAAGADQVTLQAVNHAPHTHGVHSIGGIHSTPLDTPFFSSRTGDTGQQPDSSTLSQGSATPFDIVPPYLGVYRYIVC